MTQAVHIIELMSLIGLPTIFVIVVGIVKILVEQGRRIKILMAAQQAQMRRDLIKDYYMFKNAGVISQRDLDDWEAQYQAYHSLGANGVLDAVREELMHLDKIES